MLRQVGKNISAFRYRHTQRNILIINNNEYSQEGGENKRSKIFG